MARKVTPEDIKNFNELYLKLKTYAAVARETGFSASTVKKYIIPNYVSVSQKEVKRYEGDDVLHFTTKPFLNLDNFGELCVLSEEEKMEIEELWGDMAL